MPVIGFLHAGSPEPNAKRAAAFRKGLGDAGFVEGRNVVIEYRWAANQTARLPAMAADLVNKPVNVLVTLSSTPAAMAAKAATSTIPMFFLIAEDPVAIGLVASFNRPGGNVTGISSLNVEVVAKRLGALREVAPQAAGFAILVNSANPNAKPMTDVLQATARTLGIPLQVLRANTDGEIEAAYRTLPSGSALLIATDPTFFNRRAQLIALSAQLKIPTVYDNREFADAGGLMTYGSNIESGWEQAGISVGRILKGEKPADLPVVQPTKFELVINLKTAKALGLEIPSRILSIADDVIE